jgi:hypothetical protein
MTEDVKSSAEVPLRCHIGFHSWTKWEDIDLNVKCQSYLAIREATVEKRRGQKRRCLGCNKQEQRFVG